MKATGERKQYWGFRSLSMGISGTEPIYWLNKSYKTDNWIGRDLDAF